MRNRTPNESMAKIWNKIQMVLASTAGLVYSEQCLYLASMKKSKGLFCFFVFVTPEFFLEEVYPWCDLIIFYIRVTFIPRIFW